MPPSRESSPKKSVSCKKSCGTSRKLLASKIPMAIGKSNKVPSFFKSAGAKFTVIRFAGNRIPLFLSAVEMRFLLSLMPISGRPTI